MSEELVVYTVIINRFDTLKRPLVVDPNTRYVCITDHLLPTILPWEQRIVVRNEMSPRRQSRIYKMLSHVCFPEVEYSLYIDGRIQLKVLPAQALGWLKEHDMALCEHPTDDCIYDEGCKAWDWALDDRETIRRQMQRYKEKGYPAHNGLAAGSIILRRHTEAIRRFNLSWWFEVRLGSARDQLSLNYVCWEQGLGYDVIPGHLFNNPSFVYAKGHDGANVSRLP